MQAHTTTGRWKLGLALALVPAVFWGVLPIFIKLLLGPMDGCTVAWARFTGATLILAPALALRGTLRVRGLSRHVWLLLVISALGLAGNYLFWILGLRDVSPSTAAVMVQVTPLFLAGGAMALFGERFTRGQWAGLAILFLGLGLFFNNRLGDLFGATPHYLRGVLLVALSSFVWVFYALAQKQLLRDLPSQAIMVLVYAGSALLLAPGASPRQVLALDPLHRWVLLFCILNTVIAYGALSEAFDHWEASRVSAVLPLQPLFTLGGMALVGRVWPGLLEPERVNALSVVGAVLVVVGSALTALGRAAQPQGDPGPAEPPGS